MTKDFRYLRKKAKKMEKQIKMDLRQIKVMQEDYEKLLKENIQLMMLHYNIDWETAQ